MHVPNAVKTIGYFVSTLSVLLLGIVSWETARDRPVLALCLVVGMLASCLGMLLRWISYQIDNR